MGTIVRPALGQYAELGTLYDARTDTFTPLSLLKAGTPEAAISSTKNHTIGFEYLENDSFREKFNKMGLGAELKASFLADFVNAKGCGYYLHRARDTTKTPRLSVYQRLTTVTETLQLMGPELKELLTFTDVNRGSATHLVLGITWGAEIIITAEYYNPTNQDIDGEIADDIRKDLKATLGTLQMKMPRVGGGAYKDLESQGPPKSDHYFNIQIYSDIASEKGVMPTTWVRAHRFLAKLPQYVSQANGGKGKPVSYILLPLNMLAFMYPTEYAANITLVQPSSDTIDRCIHLFDNLRGTLIAFSEYFTLIHKHQQYIPTEHLRAMETLRYGAKAQEGALRSRFSSVLKDVRSGNIRLGADQLLDLLEEYNTGACSPEFLASEVGKYTEKIEFVEFFTGHGAEYAGWDHEPDMLQITGKDTYCFHLNWDSHHRLPAFEENCALLRDLLVDAKKYHDAQIIIKDCDLSGEVVDKPYISCVRNGVAITEDLAQERRYIGDKCLMRCETGFELGKHKRPIKTAAVKLPCPGEHCSPNEQTQWICYRCHSSVVFGYDEKYLYCDCGRGVSTEWDFQCKDRSHGKAWAKYDDQRLTELLAALEPLKTLNILILGETGVGKSTFINAFVNYLTYDTLGDAMKAKQLNCIIPFSFATQVVDEKDPLRQFKETTIHSGEHENEMDGSKGQSATQKTLVHTVQLGSHTVRLFDTPGIGDTRGASQDTKNMQDILSVLSNYEELHGVLILLKPNNARLTLMFRFCIKELLTHLHRDAARNMVFGFTNTRGSNYKPGDTFEPLKHELGCNKDVQIGLFEKTVYCFDSESFRYLAAFHHGVNLGDQADYDLSWERSAKESQRLLTYFRNLEPHRVQSTVSLNETRHMITELTKPMAEIMRTMNNTIKVNEASIKSLSEDHLKKVDLEKQLYVTLNTLKAYPIDRPRTVCCDEECVEHRDNGSNPDRVTLTVVYKTHCHSPCFLDNVPMDQRAHPELINCLAFNGNNGFCKKCKHSWQLHMHVLYETREEVKKLMSMETHSKLKAAKSDMERKQIAIAEKEAFIRKIKSEHDHIEHAAIRFCVFLKKNSITPYNDATLDYLAFQIKEEKGKVNAGGDPAQLEALERYRDSYEQQVRILSERLESGQGDGSELLSEQQVREEIQSLYLLEHYGAQLRQIKSIVRKAHGNTFREQSHSVRVMANRWSVSGWTRTGLGYPTFGVLGQYGSKISRAVWGTGEHDDSTRDTDMVGYGEEESDATNSSRGEYGWQNFHGTRRARHSRRAAGPVRNGHVAVVRYGWRRLLSVLPGMNTHASANSVNYRGEITQTKLHETELNDSE